MVSGKRVDLKLQDLLNFFIRLVKLHVWISRKHGETPNLSVFKYIVEDKFRTEKYIAIQNNTERNFQAKWQLYINSLLDN